MIPLLIQVAVTGVVYICDAAGASAKLAKSVSPAFLKKMTIIYQVRPDNTSTKILSLNDLIIPICILCEYQYF